MAQDAERHRLDPASNDIRKADGRGDFLCALVEAHESDRLAIDPLPHLEHPVVQIENRPRGIVAPRASLQQYAGHGDWPAQRSCWEMDCCSPSAAATGC